MKNLLTLMLGGLVSATAFGQATLPTGWNFDDPQPTGWTESLAQNPGNTRYTNGSMGAACKLDGDDEYVVVHFSDVCGGVTYDLVGQSSATNDVFTVQESANGTDWTDLRVFLQADLDAASTFTEFTDVPMATSRYVRWYFTEKQSGRNVGLDEITLVPQVLTNEEEIGVSSNAEQIPNGGTLIVGNQTSVTITIDNVNLAGGDSLDISDIQISQSASDFSISGISLPAEIEANANLTFTLNFTAGSPGTRTGVLSIMNDDANGDETTFVIPLYAIGGDYATEPADQPNGITSQAVNSYGYEMHMQDANDIPENYIVTRGIGTATLAPPVDGETYVKGDYIDPSTQVVHVGPAANFNPSFVVAGTDYYFEAYSFNGPSGYENYLTSTAPATAMVTTPDNHIEAYYNGIDAGAPSFLTDLQTRIGQ
ncbi:MAG: hypothetical protein ACPG5W_01715, partial [Flavobacteriales bacterium]